MSFIALKNYLVAAILLLGTCTSFAADKPPRVLKEPILGLRYEVSKVHFEPASPDETAKCDTNDNITSTWFIYAKHKSNTGRTYYVMGGYSIWKRPESGQPKYEADEYGGIFYIEGQRCIYIDEARQTFIDRIFDREMDLQTLQGLASDYAVRLNTAYGGIDRVRRELRNQKVDPEALPPDLQAVLRPFFAPIH